MKKNFFGIELKIKLPFKTIDTAYATRWNREQNPNHFTMLMEEIGFNILTSSEDNNIFYIKSKKKIRL